MRFSETENEAMQYASSIWDGLLFCKMEDRDEERLFMAYYIYTNVTNVLIRFDKRDYYSTTICP